MMKKVELTAQEAKELYGAGNDKTKEMLIAKFGKEVFDSSVMDRVKTFEDACKELGILSILPAPILEENGLAVGLNAFWKLQVICRALNEGWEPDWNKTNQYKYYPWFEWTGSGFSYGGCGNDYTCTFVGSRLCFKSRELAEYAGKQFEKEYNEFLKLN